MTRNASFITLLGLLAVGMLLAAPSRRPPSSTDVGSYSFSVAFDGIQMAQFTNISRLSIENEVIEYQDGDDPLVRKRPGRINYGHVTLSKGFFMNSVLVDWAEQGRYGPTADFRKNVTITVSDNGTGKPKYWYLYNCFPVSWKTSGFDRTSTDIQVEELTLAVEWFEQN